MPSLFAQLLRIRLVFGYMRQLAVTKKIEAGIAGMSPDGVLLLDDQRTQSGVRFLFTRDGGETDDGVRLGCKVQQHVAKSRVVFGHVTKQALRRRDDLIGGLAPAGAAAHAVGDDGQHGTGIALARDDGDPILLLVAVAYVGGDASVDFKAGHAMVTVV